MKPVLIGTGQNKTCIDFDDAEYPFFYNPWHYHPELELTLILAGFGQRWVGDRLENFVEGDLVLVGSNLPHVWKSDRSFSGEGSWVKAIVVKFLPDFAGRDLFQVQEMKAIHRLIHETSVPGVRLVGHLKVLVSGLMRQMGDMTETERIIHLLKILHHISVSGEYEPLAGLTYRRSPGGYASPRIGMILDYLERRHHEHIGLEDVARLIHMNKNAFCRFFKRHTGKSAIAVLSGIRIGQACLRLQKTDEPIERISSAVGFGNISNFNRAFKIIVGTTPFNYRKAFRRSTRPGSS